MNLMGYTAAVIGNHEFNFGLEYLDRAVAQASFPFVTANVFHHGTGRQPTRPMY
jgi:2',3'-cyclic-nucleotide 2'-phosphodiesterase / 3'-nucleotidase